MKRVKDGFSGLLSDVSFKVIDRIDETLEKIKESDKIVKKVARGVDAASSASYGVAALLATNPLERNMAAAIGLGNTAFDVLRFRDEKRNLEFWGYGGEKPLSLGLAGVGTLYLARTISDALNGKIENLPYDVTFATASYLKALSSGLHSLSDKERKWKFHKKMIDFCYSGDKEEKNH